MIGLVDCNSFFCSCERLFRPDLKNKPVIVLSNNDGCIISRTQEAKDLGLKMGGPYFEVKDFCRKYDVHVFSSNFSLYTDISDRIMKTLEEFSPRVEVYSVDEAFLDLSLHKASELLEIGKEIKQRVLQNVGIPVGVGIASTKVLAKAANFLAKKSKKAQGVVCLIEPRIIDIGLSQIRIEDLWGVGRKNQVKMKSLGIKTALELKEFKNEKLIQSVFTKTGLQLKKELESINCFEITTLIPPKKSILSSRSFGKSVRELNEIKESIAYHVSLVAESLRKQKSLCLSLTVFFRTSNLTFDRSYTAKGEKRFTMPTADTLLMTSEAMKITEKVFKEGMEYKKAGVLLNHIYDKESYQLDLWNSFDQEQREKLMILLDRINAKEGKMTIKSMSCATLNGSWRMRQEFKSPRYTTAWSELYPLKD